MELESLSSHLCWAAIQGCAFSRDGRINVVVVVNVVVDVSVAVVVVVADVVVVVAVVVVGKELCVSCQTF